MRAALSILAGVLLMAATSAEKKPFELEKRELPNGLKVIVAQKPGLPIFQAILAIKSGALYEQKPGVANLTARLLDKGTLNRSAQEIADEIEGLGGSLNINANHYTLQASVSLLSDYADKGLEILSDVVLHPTFPEEEVEKQKHQIISEIHQRKSDPDNVVAERFQKEVYQGHPLGRPVEGEPEEVQTLTRQDVLDFFHKYFKPNISVLVVVTDLPPKTVFELAEKYFSGWEPGEVNYPEIPPVKKTQGKRAVVIHMDVNQAFVALGFIGLKRSDPDYNKVRLMNYILGGGGFASRFFRKVRNEMGYAYSVYSYFMPGVKYPGYYLAGVQTKLESANDAITLMLDLIRGMQEKGATEKELEDAKGYYEGSIPRQTETYSQIARALLNAEIYGLPDFYWLKDVEVILSTSLEEVQAMARKYLQPDDYVLVVAADTSQFKLHIPGLPKDHIRYENLQ